MPDAPPLTPADRAIVDGALADITAERHRQIAVEGWTPEHDDGHARGELAGAAACYLIHGARIEMESLRIRAYRFRADFWPWAESWWKPKDRRRDLVRAAALIIAEIERLDRAARLAESGNE